MGKDKREEIIKTISENTILNYQALDLLLGKYIGGGVYRDVFEYAPNPAYVIKVAKEEKGFISNVKEFDFWEEISWFKNESSWVKDWFAPVKEMSSNGSFLIMQKTEVKPKKKRPSEIPCFIEDYHSENFGWIGNRYVCHDYGSQINFTGKISKKLKRSYHEL